MELVHLHLQSHLHHHLQLFFREGLESVLILGAIITYLEASRNTKYKKYLYYGVILAIGATAVTWIVASYIIEISGANRELIEAIAALSATAILFYVSFWILNKIEHKKWMEFVKAKVWQATTTGSVLVFVGLAFFTVYREGFETVFVLSSNGRICEIHGIVCRIRICRRYCIIIGDILCNAKTWKNDYHYVPYLDSLWV